jgi:hypothetical protein
MNRNQVINVWLPRLEYGLHWARMHLIVIAVCYCLIYIGQVTRTNNLGQKLNTYLRQRDAVYEQMQELNILAAQARSINSIQSRSQGLVQPTSVLFAKP